MKLTTRSTTTAQLLEIINEIVLPCTTLAAQQQMELEVHNDLASFITVAGDVHNQKKLLHLILTSAIQYSQASKIVFSTRQLLQSDKEALVEFSLVDNGASRKPKSKNIDYFRSLVTARNLVEKLGGKSELVASPGLNTTFKFILKYEWQRTLGSSPHSSAGQKLEGKKILVAEDNEVSQKVIKQMLREQGAGVDFANNGKEAVDAFERKANEYDLILTDLHMPYMDGFQVAHYIRKKFCSSIPIVALMTDTAAITYEKCREAGMNHFIQKPFTESELLVAIDKVSAIEYGAAC